jgi:hypothetical protein
MLPGLLGLFILSCFPCFDIHVLLLPNAWLLCVYLKHKISLCVCVRACVKNSKFCAVIYKRKYYGCNAFRLSSFITSGNSFRFI